jgi:hypothetical protein
MPETETGAAVLEVARSLRPRILAERDRIEASRRLPDDIARELSSRPKEFHLRALPEPCMTLSSHTAPDVRPLP